VTHAATAARETVSGVSPEPVVVAGVRISHPERIVYPDSGLSKGDVARYYERVGRWIAPHVRARPLTLVHCPKGVAGPCTYMKHSKLWGPDVLRRVRIQEKTKVGEYMVADDLAGIVGIAQMGALEIHTWNSTTDNLEQPNRIVWDLDPGPAATWEQVITAARTVREILRTLGLESWVKTTGGRGLHVVLPIVPRRDWSECLAFSRAVAEAISATGPALYTTAFAKHGREGKILIDYLRNNRTNTSVAAYSTRAQPGATISVPIAWTELTTRLRPEAFTVKTVPRRLARLRDDPWSGYWSSGQRVSDAALRAVARL
jgi:bifunctional non-homologous end joining protein LigD